VRLITSVASRLQRWTAAELAPSNVAAWREVRQAVRARVAPRAQGLRVRRDPDASVRGLEQQFLTSGLPV
jgi:hypothetical protein